MSDRREKEPGFLVSLHPIIKEPIFCIFLCSFSNDIHTYESLDKNPCIPEIPRETNQGSLYIRLLGHTTGISYLYAHPTHLYSPPGPLFSSFTGPPLTYSFPSYANIKWTRIRMALGKIRGNTRNKRLDLGIRVYKRTISK